MVSIGVVGGGIIGIATTYAVLQDYPEVKVGNCCYSELIYRHSAVDCIAADHSLFREIQSSHNC